MSWWMWNFNPFLLCYQENIGNNGSMGLLSIDSSIAVKSQNSGIDNTLTEKGIIVITKTSDVRLSTETYLVFVILLDTTMKMCQK